MRFYSKASLKRWSVAAAVPLFTACASVAPGLHINTGAGYTSSGTSGEGSGDAAVLNATLKPITPQLVKTEREMREKQVTQDISKLLGKPASYTIDADEVMSIVV